MKKICKNCGCKWLNCSCGCKKFEPKNHSQQDRLSGSIPESSDTPEGVSKNNSSGTSTLSDKIHWDSWHKKNEIKVRYVKEFIKRLKEE